MPEKRGGEFLRGLAWNIPASIGAPADLAETVLNLGLAGGGYLGHKLGLLRADQLPQLLEGSPGTTKWWAKGTPMEESTDPAFVRGQLTGGLAAAAYGMLPQMRMRQGQVNAITWHGSPHKFDRFDSSKIGTGEGAQAYGHGLYLADAPAVAGSYTKAEQPVLAGGALLDETNPTHIAAAGLHLHRGSRANAIADLQWSIDHPHLFPDSLVPVYKEAIRIIKAQERTPSVVGGTGNLYKVDLPDEAIARMLDWDKPLSQQGAIGRSVIEGLDAEELLVKAGSRNEARLTGRDAYEVFSDFLTQGGASREFRSMGIPGIRYLDGGSRAAGSGSYNYVVFPGEEGLLRILERNGVPLQQGLAEGPVLQKGLAKP